MADKKFKNKEEALERLLEIMPIADMQDRDYLILALSYAGVWFANELSKVLQSPFDLFFSAVIPAPLNPSCPVAMVSETYDLVTHDALIQAFDISNDYVYGEAKRRYEDQIRSAIYQFRKGQMICPLKGKDVIVVDWGIDSGMAATTAIKSCVNAKVNSVSVAVPVVPHEVEIVLRNIVDHIYTVWHPLHFMEIESYYESYDNLSGEEIEQLLDQARTQYSIK